MKEFLLSSLPDSILAVDISGARRQFYPNHQFASWTQAEKFFLDLGAPTDVLDAALASLNENGLAKIAF